MAKKSVYARLASRFAHLALGAKDDDEDKDDKAAEAEDDEASASEDDDEDKDPPADKKKSRKAKSKNKAEDDEDDDEEANASDDKDEDEKCEAAAASARATERERWATVMSSTEAKGRVPLACSLLADTDMAGDKIRAALLASPAESGKGGLATRMAAVPRADVGSGPAARPDPRSPSSQAAAITEAYNKAVGTR